MGQGARHLSGDASTLDHPPRQPDRIFERGESDRDGLACRADGGERLPLPPLRRARGGARGGRATIPAAGAGVVKSNLPDVDPGMSMRETFAIMRRALRFAGEMKARFAVKLLAGALAFIPLVVLPLFGKVLIDHVILG